MEHPAGAAHRQGRRCERREQGERHAVARGVRVRRPARRRPLQQGGRGPAPQTRGGSEARKALPGPEQVSMRLKSCERITPRPLRCRETSSRRLCVLALKRHVHARLIGMRSMNIDAAEELVTCVCIAWVGAIASAVAVRSRERTAAATPQTPAQSAAAAATPARDLVSRYCITLSQRETEDREPVARHG